MKLLLDLMLLIFCGKSMSVELVQTKSGKVRGLHAPSTSMNKVTAFLGVPFAEPPVDQLRFRPPVPRAKWNGVFNADQPAASCYLPIDNTFGNFSGSQMWNGRNRQEDCLAMNIWVPRKNDGTVLVWIFGGGYFSGSPSLDLYNGVELAARKSAIVVNINYRLGPFGFLYFGNDSSVQGNVGLLDQQLALIWVNENIGLFGGDNTRITLLGESAGGASVSSHLFAPGSRKLFRRAIMQSGTVLNVWALQPRDVMLNRSLKLAKKLNCDRKHIEEIIACVQKKLPREVQDAADKITGTLEPLQFAFVPVEEDANFFQGNVLDKIRDRDFKKDVDILAGTVADEGSYWLPYYLLDHGFKFYPDRIGEEINRMYINRSQYESSIKMFSGYFKDSTLVTEALLHKYDPMDHHAHHHSKKRRRRHHNANRKYRDAVSIFVGDYFFTCDVIRLVDILSENINGDVYVYYFKQRSSANAWPEWMGVMHGYEIEYVFGVPFRKPEKYEVAEQEFSGNVMKFWVDFASSGVPTPSWPKYTVKSRKHFVLDSIVSQNRTRSNLRNDQCQLLLEARTKFSDDDKSSSSFACALAGSSASSLFDNQAVSAVCLITYLAATLFNCNFHQFFSCL